ncbi:hypothetical protein PPL19_07696 [Pseudomonas psychrotolerans L19]|nr:hypothetical protein PPL19_07696 [Pseudomonas psychrotolerans L19]KTT53670.1 hypothetical protein NS337_12215 [Pseudomonas psychrotolerans]
MHPIRLRQARRRRYRPIGQVQLGEQLLDRRGNFWEGRSERYIGHGIFFLTYALEYNHSAL